MHAAKFDNKDSSGTIETLQFRQLLWLQYEPLWLFDTVGNGEAWWHHEGPPWWTLFLHDTVVFDCCLRCQLLTVITDRRVIIGFETNNRLIDFRFTTLVGIVVKITEMLEVGVNISAHAAVCLSNFLWTGKHCLYSTLTVTDNTLRGTVDLHCCCYVSVAWKRLQLIVHWTNGYSLIYFGIYPTVWYSLDYSKLYQTVG